ncbi:lysozyme inhibitor LprI family protein [Pseudomonas sp. SMV7]|uniref:lysozyme inhibitor LprI family protein n=1 Tax=Pseudomonas sp. SMV7 TaxID=3390194 RepID=UPI003F844346
MKKLYKSICMGFLLVMSNAHADVGREEELDEAVRQFAAKVETVWQQCLKRPDVRTTNDSNRCLVTMLRATNDAVEQKYQVKLEKARDMAKHPDAFATYETVPGLLEESQAQWKKYVKTDCDGIGAESAGGTARSTFALRCEYQHALHRLRALDAWF